MAKEQVKNFETSLEKLEGIVEDLESGELSLEEMLKKYEEGVKLSNFCNQTLNKAEQKIEILSKSADGEIDLTETDEDLKPKKKKAAKKKI